MEHDDNNAHALNLQYLFEAQVRHSPHKIAVCYGDLELTYQQLNTRANQLAGYLRASIQVQPDTLIPIVIDRSLEMIIGILAVLKSGAAYVPIQPNFPAERIRHMLQGCGGIILTQGAHSLKIQALIEQFHLNLKLLELDNDWDCVTVYPPENIINTTHHQHLAYVIYTSGTTGNPKGVMIQHDNLMHFFNAINRHLRVDENTVLLAGTEFTFDISVLEILLPLLNGGCCVLVNKDTMVNQQLVSALIFQHKVTIMQATPSTWQVLLTKNFLIPADMQILCGGEALTANLAKQLLTYVHSFWNVYGPTEATIWSTLHEIKRGESLLPISIGKPLANTSIFIMDANMNIVPDGETGELHIAGPSLARGYLNQPELTHSKFVHCLIHSNNNIRLYKTGDQARILHDGTIEFIGRNDDQFKIRGLRIEAGEIESQLLNHQNVQQSVVLVKSTEDDKHLIAYIVPKQLTSIDMHELDHFLRQYLPVYMLPNAYVMLDAIPLTAHGKIDRQALLRYPINNLTSNRLYVAPQTHDEKVLVLIWSDLLKINSASLSVDEKFFLLGGHSLLAIQMITRIRTQFQIELTLSDIFSYTTIKELAGYINSKKKNPIELPVRPTCKRRQAGSSNVLSFAQERLWFLDQLQPESSFYHIVRGLHLRGAVNLAALKKAFCDLIVRHESLRTIFTRENDHLKQTIIEHENFPFDAAIEVIQASSIEKASAQAAQYAKIPFDLSAAPLLRVKIFQILPDEYLIVMLMHHIITDDWSMGIINHEIGIMYQAAMTNKTPALIPLPIQYADYSSWQREWLQGTPLQQQLRFWRNQLNDLTTLEFPTDYPRPPIQTFVGSQCPVSLSPALTKQIRQLSLQANVTLFTALFSVFTLILGRYSRQEDIVVGTPVAGRLNQEIENLVGFFVNTLVLRSNLAGQPDFMTLLQRNHHMALASFANQDAPFEKVVETVDPARDPSRSPLFQIMFVLQNAPQHEWDIVDVNVTPYPLKLNIAKFDLTLLLSEHKDQISGVIEFNTDLFKAETIQCLWLHYTNLLQQVVTQPLVPVTQLSMLTDLEQKKVLIDWNQTDCNYSYDTTLHQLFEEQVQRTPNHIAVTYLDSQLTYRELNSRANQLAHYLRKNHNLQPDSLVPIIVDKSIEMIVGLLGVLKAGSAYVPINPSLPQERIRYMLDDCKASLVLIQEHIAEKMQAFAADDNDKLVYLLLDRDWKNIADYSQENPQSLSGPHNLAYLIYTSGSTGQPKGVMIEHGGIVNTLLSQIPLFQISNTSRTLQFASFSFDSAVGETFRTLLSGATLVLNPAALNTPGEVLAETLERQQISIVTLPPAALELLPVRKYSTLRTLVSAGEACTADLMNRWAVDYRCINAYGPTEISICATLAVCKISANKPSIGKPLANVLVYVLNEYMQPLPINVRGELYIGGPGVSRGYLNLPELTQSKFIANPFSTNPAARLYKTGDMVRWLPDGSLEFLGRDDDQVKIRGFRIELGEIERQLQSHADIAQSVVLRKETEHDAKLIAYLTPANLAVLNPNELRDFLSARLPDYMLPNAFVIMEKLPMTTNQKIDKKALLMTPITTLSSEKKYQHPRNQMEFQLVKLWKNILKVDSVGIRENFFALGGHSLLLVSLLIQIEKIFNKKLPISLIYAKPTIEQLAAAMMTEESTAAVSPVVTLRETGNRPPLFLIHEVTGIAFHYLTLSHHINAEHPIYGIQDPTAGKEARFASIKEMATSYASSIRKIQHHGPYHLAGWCLGGVIAYEIAQQLLAEGETVARIILIDSPMNMHKKRQMKLYTEQFNEIKTLISEGNSLTLHPAIKDKSTWLNQVAAEFMHRIMLMREYKPDVYPEPDAVTLIKASEPTDADDIITPSKDNGWLAYVPDIKIYSMPGNHQSIIKEPHVRQLANIINNEMLMCENTLNNH